MHSLLQQKEFEPIRHGSKPLVGPAYRAYVQDGWMSDTVSSPGTAFSTSCRTSRSWSQYSWRRRSSTLMAGELAREPWHIKRSPTLGVAAHLSAHHPLSRFQIFPNTLLASGVEAPGSIRLGNLRIELDMKKEYNTYALNFLCYIWKFIVM